MISDVDEINLKQIKKNMSTSRITKSIRWFKTTFAKELNEAVKDTPFDINLLSAIAYQETGYVWGKYIDSLSVDEILTICVGDTIDYPRRKAFPRNREALENHAQGKEMFKIARSALLHVANFEAGYRGVAKKSHKFCRGYGIFQYDLQFFKEDPDYFLNKDWEDFSRCLAKFIKELFQAKSRQGWKSKITLNRTQKIHVAIAYNKGKSTVSKGFKQGHKSGGKYYGENIDRFYKIAESIGTVNVVSADSKKPQPNPVAGQVYSVKVNSYLTLRERGTKYSAELARLKAGQIVVRLADEETGSYWRIEASLNGTIYRGYVASKYLQVINSVPIAISAEITHLNLDKVPKYIRTELATPSPLPKYRKKGAAVKKLQEWLCLHHCDTSIDGDFGPATKRTVKKFQSKMKLNPSGVVTLETWKALVQPMRDALREPTGVSGMTLPEAFLASALQHVELPIRPFEVGGANAGPWVRLYCRGRDGADWLWCAGFVSTLLKQAAFYSKHDPLINGSESCDTLQMQASALGRFITESQITSGEFDTADFGACAIFLRKKRHGDWNHTGIAHNFSGSGEDIVFDTIEGNTNAGGSRNGGEARKAVKSLSSKHYDFINLA